MTEENFDKIMANAQPEEVQKNDDNYFNAESDKDSDYGGSDYDTGEATTFRMLIEKSQVNDREFIEACQSVGLIAQYRYCPICITSGSGGDETGTTEEVVEGVTAAAGGDDDDDDGGGGEESSSSTTAVGTTTATPINNATTATTTPPSSIMMILEDCSTSLDGVEWKCLQCDNRLSIREGTWLEDVRQVRMKDIILILYCWARNYPEQLCQHEMDLVEVQLVPFVYKKCQKLCSEYFNHEISNIGGPNTIVEIEEFQTPAGLHIVGGVEKHNLKNVFFRVLPENWTRDDLCTAIADNIISATNIHCHNQTVVEILGNVGVRYLSRVWRLALDTSATCDSPLVASLWALFERLISDQDYTEHSLLQFLYRRRMEVYRDPFLATIHIISRIHPPLN